MKKGSKLIFGLCLTIGLLIVFISCASSSDKMSRSDIETKAITASVLMLTGEDNPILVIPGGTCIVRSVNGIAISSSAFTGWGATMKTTYYRIPSGNVRLRVDPYNSERSSFRSTDVDFNASPGRIYRINIISNLLRFNDITESINQ